MSKKEKEILKRLERLRIELLKYCHTDNCEALEEDPSLHEKCAKNLGLDTSIAWEAARLLYRLDTEHYSRGWIPFPLLDIVKRSMLTLCLVVGRHKAQYPGLYGLLDTAYARLEELMNYLGEVGQ